jgi:hypothetical protein
MLARGRIAHKPRMSVRYHPCVLWLTMGLTCATAAAQQPERLTTDTANYCTQLELRVAAERSFVTGAPAADVQRLFDVGHKLCDQGQIRFGIAHLRTALRIIHHTQDRTATGP